MIKTHLNSDWTADIMIRIALHLL